MATDWVAGQMGEGGRLAGSAEPIHSRAPSLQGCSWAAFMSNTSERRQSSASREREGGEADHQGKGPSPAPEGRKSWE